MLDRSTVALPANGRMQAFLNGDSPVAKQPGRPHATLLPENNFGTENRVSLRNKSIRSHAFMLAVFLGLLFCTGCSSLSFCTSTSPAEKEDLAGTSYESTEGKTVETAPALLEDVKPEPGREAEAGATDSRAFEQALFMDEDEDEDDPVLQAYLESAINKVSSNWDYTPGDDRRICSAVVNIQVDTSGNITTVRIVAPSESSTFDSSILQAVQKTGRLEPPPGRNYQSLTVTFMQ